MSLLYMQTRHSGWTEKLFPRVPFISIGFVCVVLKFNQTGLTFDVKGLDRFRTECGSENGGLWYII